MNRVFLIEQPRNDLNLSTAKDFGDLYVLFPFEEHRTSVFNCSEFGEEVISRLKDVGFDQNKDLVCVAGSMITVIVAVTAMIVEYESVDVLFFNATVNHYVRRTLGSKKQ